MAAKASPPLPSERSFGLLFSGVAGVAALWSVWHAYYWAATLLALAGVGLLALALTRPLTLAVPNRLWFKLGMLLNAVVSPIVLGAIFFLIITPVGVMRRLLGADALRLKADPKLATYWVSREKAVVQPSSFKNQF